LARHHQQDDSSYEAAAAMLPRRNVAVAHTTEATREHRHDAMLFRHGKDSVRSIP